MTDMLAEMRLRLAAMPADQRKRLGREMSGAADDDLIRRGDVYGLIRQLRGLAPPAEYQRALRDVQQGVSDLDPPA